MYLIYSALLALAAAVTFPYFLVQGWRHGKYLGSLRARLGGHPKRNASGGGRAPAPRRPENAIWLHAVSVGELLACQGLVAALKARFPQRELLLSTTTETGFRTAADRIRAGALAADSVFFCPFDFAFAVRRVLRRVRPALLLVAETELWPNLFREASRAGVPLALINARVSDRSFPRYRRFRFFFRDVLNRAALLLAQSDEDARRLGEIGAGRERVRVAGNLKYETRAIAPLPPWLDSQVMRWSGGGLLLAGSTAAGEEEPVLAAFAQLRKSRSAARSVTLQEPAALRLIIAPRRPERFDEVAQMAASRGFGVARRSRLSPGSAIDTGADILLLDTVGELGAFYRHATVAFVGGSLVPHGGQNILEPAQFARPIVVGPYTHNFREITGEFRAAGALLQLASAAELPGALEHLFHDPQAAAGMGAAALRLLEANRGATARVVEAVAGLLPAGVSETPLPQAIGAPSERAV